MSPNPRRMPTALNNLAGFISERVTSQRLAKSPSEPCCVTGNGAIDDTIGMDPARSGRSDKAMTYLSAANRPLHENTGTYNITSRWRLPPCRQPGDVRWSMLESLPSQASPLGQGRAGSAAKNEAG